MDLRELLRCQAETLVEFLGDWESHLKSWLSDSGLNIWWWGLDGLLSPVSRLVCFFIIFIRYRTSQDFCFCIITTVASSCSIFV